MNYEQKNELEIGDIVTVISVDREKPSECMKFKILLEEEEKIGIIISIGLHNKDLEERNRSFSIRFDQEITYRGSKTNCLNFLRPEIILISKRQEDLF